AGRFLDRVGEAGNSVLVAIAVPDVQKDLCILGWKIAETELTLPLICPRKYDVQGATGSRANGRVSGGFTLGQFGERRASRTLLNIGECEQWLGAQSRLSPFECAELNVMLEPINVTSRPHSDSARNKT